MIELKKIETRIAEAQHLHQFHLQQAEAHRAEAFKQEGRFNELSALFQEAQSDATAAEASAEHKAEAALTVLEGGKHEDTPENDHQNA